MQGRPHRWLTVGQRSEENDVSGYLGEKFSYILGAASAKGLRCKVYLLSSCNCKEVGVAGVKWIRGDVPVSFCCIISRLRA